MHTHLKNLLFVLFFATLSFFFGWKSSNRFRIDSYSKGVPFQDRPSHKFCYKESSIVFFHLTNRTDQWHPLQVCAFKTAAIINNDTSVCVLTAHPMKDDPALGSIPNLEILPMNITYLLEGTPLAKWYDNFVLNKSTAGQYAMYELSDGLRYAYLNKFGGYYMDSDVLTLRKFTHLRNVAGWEFENEVVCTAVMFFDKNHPVINASLERFMSSYDAGKWGSVGPWLLTSVILSDRFINKTGFNVINGFYPTIPGEDVELPFLPEKMQQITSMVNQSYTLHLWRKVHFGWKYWDLNTLPNGSFVQELCDSV